MGAKVQPIQVEDDSAVTALLYTMARDYLNRDAVEAMVERMAPGGRRGRNFDYTNPERALWAQGLADKLK